jgi:hypothetical protein
MLYGDFAVYINIPSGLGKCMQMQIRCHGLLFLQQLLLCSFCRASLLLPDKETDVEERCTIQRSSSGVTLLNAQGMVQYFSLTIK